MINFPLLWLLQKPVSNNQTLKENFYLSGICRQGTKMFSMLTATTKVKSVGTVTIPGGTSFSPGMLFYFLYSINMLINISIPFFFFRMPPSIAS